MKITHTLGIVLAAAVLPAAASAQPDPNSGTTTTTTTTPSGGTTTTTGNTPTAPIPPAPTTTDPMPPPPPQEPVAPAPVVIVNPPQPASHTTTYVQPEGDEVYDSWNAPVFATGALVFAGSYGAAAIASSVSDHVGADRLWVPVVGPWLALNDWGNCPISQPRCDTNTTDKVLLVADGVFQAVGVIAMVDGLLMPSHHRVVSRTADTKVHVTPTGTGFAVFGHF